MQMISCPFDDPTPLFRHGGGSASGPMPPVDFSVNCNPLGPSLTVRHALRLALAAVARYPDPECRALVERLSRIHRVEPAQLLIGNGATDLIYTIARALRPRQAAIAEPTFTEYLRASRAVGARVEHWLAEGAEFRVEPFDVGGSDLVWLCNPNNPTGRLWPRDVLSDWIRSFPRTVFVIDEAFLPFLQDQADHTLISPGPWPPNLIVLRSLTKLYTLPGLRLGYVVTSPALADRLRHQTPPWSANALAQEAGLAALADEVFLAQTHAWLGGERDRLFRDLAALPQLAPLPSRANFLLVRLDGLKSEWLARTLAARGIVIRDAANFIGLGSHHVRLAVRLPEDNQRLVTELRSILVRGV